VEPTKQSRVISMATALPISSGIDLANLYTKLSYRSYVCVNDVLRPLR
jgi:hypothetical protein